MKYSLVPPLILSAAFSMAPGSVSASSYQSFHCHCVPPDCGNCSCTDSYTLGAMVTKEFRAYCDNTDEDAEYPNIAVNDRNSNTTCTVQLAIMAQPYRSKSCTNWSLFHSDGLSIKVTCHDWKYDTDLGKDVCL